MSVVCPIHLAHAKIVADRIWFSGFAILAGVMAEGFLVLFGIHASLMAVSVLPDKPLAWTLLCVLKFP